MISPLRATLTLPNDTAELHTLRTFLHAKLGTVIAPASELNKIVLAVDEAVSNIIQHAYDRDARAMIDVEVEVEGRRLTIFIRDSGRTFDPGHTTELEINRHVREGRRRGLGIFLMRRIMDEVHYNFKEGVRNELVLVKHLQREEKS